MTDGASDRLALGTRDRGPAVWLMNLETGDSVPIPTKLNRRHAFDHGLGRRSWVAAQVGYQVGAFTDAAGLFSPVVLTQAWTVYPAASDDLVLLLQYFGRSSEPGEKHSMAVAGSDGTVHRSVELPWGVDDAAFVAGEVEAGVVTWQGIGGWDGSITALPIDVTGDGFTDPRPVGVLCGRVIVFEGVAHVESVDVVSGRVTRLRIPPVERSWPSSSRFDFRKHYNADASWLQAADDLGSVIAGVNGELRWLPHEGRRRSSLWLGDRLMFFGRGEQSSVEYDPTGDAYTPAQLGPVESKGPWPRIDVTGRFSFADAVERQAVSRAVPKQPRKPAPEDDFSWLPTTYSVTEFAGGASEEAIREAERRIGPFPRGYRAFVAMFGAALLDGLEIFGIGDGSKRWPGVVEQTVQERELPYKRLPASLIAIFSDRFGNTYCVASPATPTADGPHDEAVYVWWHDDDSEAELVAETFETWLRNLPPPE